MSIPLPALLALAKKLGVSLVPEELAKDKLAAKFTHVQARVVARLEQDKITPKELSDNEEEKRHLIRAAEYFLWKETVASITGTPVGSDRVADAIRDRHDDNVVPAVMPQVTAALTTAALVEAVAAAELEQTT